MGLSIRVYWGIRVQDLGFKVRGVGFRVESLGLRAIRTFTDLGFRVGTITYKEPPSLRVFLGAQGSGLGFRAIRIYGDLAIS